MKTLFCSDLHFSHKNILRFEPTRIDAIYETFKDKFSQYTKETFREHVLDLYNHRDSQEFKDMIELHDEMLIKRWNETVSASDTVWFLGDFSIGSRKTLEYVKRLKGEIYLIKGNHDQYSEANYLEAGFKKVYSYPVVLKHKYVLSHAPFTIMENTKDLYFVYGHIHSSEGYKTFTENSCCACVERHDFRPFRLPEFEKYQEELIPYPTPKEAE